MARLDRPATVSASTSLSRWVRPRPAPGQNSPPRRPRRQAEPAPYPVHQQQRGDLPDPGLDRLKANQIRLERIEDLADARTGPFGRQVDGRVVGERFRVAGFGGLVPWSRPGEREPRPGEREPRPRHGGPYLVPAGRSSAYGWMV